jgi:glycosyltransferase involved in cell wall biosynthesis
LQEKNLKRIVFTVTSDPNYDQRMIRICTSLQKGGYDVLLIGRQRPNSKELIQRSFKQKRIKQRIDSGKLFYVSYWLKLLFKLLFIKTDVYCAIDLDTILPVLLIAKLKRKKIVYDAHELFCELEEVVHRPLTLKAWKWIEKISIPQMDACYTVNKSLKTIFESEYNRPFAVVRNISTLKNNPILYNYNNGYILYQGAINVGRCFEHLIPAMQYVDRNLIICGEGNYLNKAKELVTSLNLNHKIIFKGYIPPHELEFITQQACIGITLFIATSGNNKLSLANRFFDYMQAGIPQIAMNYPEYANINAQYEVAQLIDIPNEHSIAKALNELLSNETYYQKLHNNSLEAKKIFCWENEENVLLNIYKNLFHD